MHLQAPAHMRGMPQGLVFDYYVDDAQVQMVHWDQRVPAFTYSPDASAAVFVPTMETTRLTHFLDTLVARKHHVMFVGNTGTACALPGFMQPGVHGSAHAPGFARRLGQDGDHAAQAQGPGCGGCVLCCHQPQLFLGCARSADHPGAVAGEEVRCMPRL